MTVLDAEKYMTAKVVKLETGEWSFSSLVRVKREPGDGDGLQGSALNKLKDGDIDESMNP